MPKSVPQIVVFMIFTGSSVGYSLFCFEMSLMLPFLASPKIAFHSNFIFRRRALNRFLLIGTAVDDIYIYVYRKLNNDRYKGDSFNCCKHYTFLKESYIFHTFFSPPLVFLHGRNVSS